MGGPVQWPFQRGSVMEAPNQLIDDSSENDQYRRVFKTNRGGVQMWIKSPCGLSRGPDSYTTRIG